MPTSFKRISPRNTEISCLYYVADARGRNFRVCLKDYAFNLDYFQAARPGSRSPLDHKCTDILFQGLKDCRNRL